MTVERKTMLIQSRGCSKVVKKIMNDLNSLIHSHVESKNEDKNNLKELYEIMDMNECTGIIYFESTKRTFENPSVWMAKEGGPTIKFKIYNMFNMQELRFITNCSVGRGSVCLFDENFQDTHLKLVKDVLNYIFTNRFSIKIKKEDDSDCDLKEEEPLNEIENETKENCNEEINEKIFYEGNNHTNENFKEAIKEMINSQKIDKAFCFYYLDNKIWLRVYTLKENIVEIGPRMVLEVEKILENCLSGEVVYRKEKKIQE